MYRGHNIIDLWSNKHVISILVSGPFLWCKMLQAPEHSKGSFYKVI